ncbi:MAG: NosD domain-containing protein [Pseudomonadota bacterium]
MIPEPAVICTVAGATTCSKTVCVPETGECLPQPAPNWTLCEDGNPCTVSDHCDGGACAPGASVCQCEGNEDCALFDDGDLCNGTLFCDTVAYPHGCKVIPETAVVCDPAGDTTCSKTVCVPETGDCLPQAAQDGTLCEDGNPCTVSDHCAGGVCTPGASVCQCEGSEDCALFDDGDLCNGTLFCDTAAYPHECEVIPETAVVCSTAGDTTCSKTLCVPETGECLPQPVPDGLLCEDGNPCTVSDHCQDGTCASGPSVCQCETDDDCGDFEDDDLCNGTLFCDEDVYPHVCKVTPDTVVLCDDGGDTVCSENLCDPATGECQLQALQDGTACEDGHACTVNDACQDGACASGTSVCQCESDGDCTPLEDGNLCNGTLLCSKAAYPYLCSVDPATVVTCSTDGDTLCSKTACLPQTGTCVALPVPDGTLCTDGNSCTVDDSCEGGSCVPGASVCQCQQDGDCTGFDDGNLCNGTLVCGAAYPYACLVNPGTVVTCETSGDTICSKTLCVPASGSCVAQAAANGTACSDSDPCTLDDVCADGTCVAGSDLCDCTTDGDCAAWDDDDLCNGSLRCDLQAFPHVCVLDADTVVTCDPGEDTECTVQECAPETGVCGAVPANEAAACGGAQHVCVSGICTCLGACAGKECGDDGCGGQCGTCTQYPNSLCQGAACACTPACDGAVCGDNGCGGSCGTCTAPFVCTEGQCQSGCPGGAQPCNGICVDYTSDAQNCETCGTVCLTTDPALLGSCVASFCTPGACADDHWNLDGNPGNGCEYLCAPVGAEACNEADDNCDGSTDEGFDLNTDLDHCGGCDQLCAPPHAQVFDCIAGTCTIIMCEANYKNINGITSDGCETPYTPQGELWVDSWNIGDPLEDGTQAHPFSTIQKAIDASFEGYQIHVLAGYYAGSNTVDVPLLSISGVSKEDVNVSNSPSATGFLVTADGVTVENMQIYGGHVGIHFQGTAADKLSGGDVSNVEIFNVNATGAGAGIYIEQTNLVKVSLADIHNLEGAVGIRLLGATASTLSDNTFSELYNQQAESAGVLLAASQSVTVSGSQFDTLAGGQLVAGVYASASSACTVSGNSFNLVTGGPGNNVSNNPYVGGTGRVGAGVYLTGTTGCTLSGNTVTEVTGGAGGNAENNGTGGTGGVGAGVYLVSSTGNTLSGNVMTSIEGGLAGTGALKPGTPERGFGVYLDAGSLDNQVALTNTLAGEEIVYINGADGTVIQGLSLIADVSPTNWGKITVVDSTGVQILENTVANFVGPVSMDAGGIRLVGCTACAVSDNVLSGITGGRGQAGKYGNDHRTGGPGGKAVGLWVADSTGGTISGNEVTDVTGGNGGTCSYAGSGGAGGLGLGIYLTGSSSNTFSANVLEATGGAGGDVNQYGAVGASQPGMGVYLESSAYDNTIDLTNTFQGEAIAYLYGADGVTIEGLDLTGGASTTNLGKIVVIDSTDVEVLDNAVTGFTGIAGQSGAQNQPGAVGEVGVGIRIEGCTDTLVAGNTVSGVLGGAGGGGGFSGGCTGGAGNTGFGIHVLDSTGCTFDANTVTGIQGGTGGQGGYTCAGGAGGASVGFFADGSDSTTVSGDRVQEITSGMGGPPGYSASGQGGGGLAIGYDLLNLTSTTFENNIAWKILHLAGYTTNVSVACVRIRTCDVTKVQNCVCHDSGLTGFPGGHGVWVDGVSPNAVQLLDTIVDTVSGYGLFSDAQNGPMILTAVYSDIHACEAGQASNAALAGTCIDLDPLFVDAGAGNFHLQSTSPCIDTGKPLTGCSLEPAPNGCRVNMGAYGNTAAATSAAGATHCTPCPTP